MAGEDQDLSAHLGKNVELKARVSHLATARKIALDLEAQPRGVQEQVDTYFVCAAGRLKLRQINGLGAELIWYARPDQPGARTSLYHRAPVSHPETLKTVLGAALGILSVVQKRREIFLWHNVRIHLDEVADLGRFIEFEAVLQADQEERFAQAQLAELTEKFHIQPADLVASSYAEMLFPSQF